jgi:hypothetical protein
MAGDRPRQARTARILLAVSALLLTGGAIVHARAFPHADAAIASARLAPFYANSFRGLWLADSATLAILGIAFALIAFRPTAASRGVVALLALIAAATAAMIYFFVGPFPAPHLLVVAASSAMLGGLLLPVPATRAV